MLLPEMEPAMNTVGAIALLVAIFFLKETWKEIRGLARDCRRHGNQLARIEGHIGLAPMIDEHYPPERERRHFHRRQR